MKDNFEELIKNCKKSLDLDPWSKERGLRGYAKELQGEVDELIEGINKQDKENIQEELGDIMLDWIHAVILAEKEIGIKGEDVIRNVNHKLIARKPYIKEGKKVSKEESAELWKKAKCKK